MTLEVRGNAHRASNLDKVTKMKPENVIVIGDLGSTSRTGGGQIFLRNLLFLLSSLEHQKNIYCFTTVHETDVTTLYNQLEAANPNLKIISTKVPSHLIGHPFVDLKFFFSIRAKIKNLKPDLIIHDQPSLLSIMIQGEQNITFFHGPIGRKKRKFSFVSHRTGSFLKQLKSFLKQRIWQDFIIRLGIKLKIRFAGKSDYFICNSEYTKNLLLEVSKIPNEKMTVLGLPVDCTSFKPSSRLRQDHRKKYGISNNEVVLLFASNFSLHKQPIFAEKVSEIILQKYPNVKIAFVGRSVDNEILDEFSQAKSRIIRLHEVNHNELISLYNMADVLFSTSKSETFGYTLVEGMACGKPTVAISGGSQIEYMIHRRNALMCTSLEDFVQSLSYLIEDSNLRDTLGNQAQRIIEQKYSIPAYSHNLKKLLCKTDSNAKFSS